MAPPKVKNPKKSAKYYRENADARRKKAATDKKINARPEQRKKRSELKQWRRDQGIDGKGGPDGSHTKSGRIVKENPSKNRARNRGKK